MLSFDSTFPANLVGVGKLRNFTIISISEFKIVKELLHKRSVEMDFPFFLISFDGFVQFAKNKMSFQQFLILLECRIER